MTLKNTVIQPGFLVGLRSSVTGGVRYFRRDVDREADGKVSKWETTKVVDDPAELEAAVKARGAARYEIASVCINTGFGLVCPAKYEAELDAAIVRAFDKRNEFNATKAKTTRVDLFVFKARIAETDEQAARAIAAEIRDLIESMDKGIKTADRKMIRQAANDAVKLKMMLSDEQQTIVGKAIDAARLAASKIVARIEKEGEAAEQVLAELDTTAIDAARFAFLDNSTEAVPTTTEAPEVPIASPQRFADLDFGGLEVLDAV